MNASPACSCERRAASRSCTEQQQSTWNLLPTAYLEPVPICTRRFETRYVQIQCNTGTYSQTFFPSAIRLWNTLPADICQLPPDSFKTHLNRFRFISAPDYVLFLSSALHCFYPKLLFTVWCTDFSIHICLFTRGAILLEIESAPLSEDEDEVLNRTCLLTLELITGTEEKFPGQVCVDPPRTTVLTLAAVKLERRRQIGPTDRRPVPYAAPAAIDRYLLPAPGLWQNPAALRCCLLYIDRRDR